MRKFNRTDYALAATWMTCRVGAVREEQLKRNFFMENETHDSKRIIKPHTLIIEIGKCIKLAHAIMDTFDSSECDERELYLEALSDYYFVCLGSEKYLLDWKKAKEAFKIDEMIKKFVVI